MDRRTPRTTPRPWRPMQPDRFDPDPAAHAQRLAALGADELWTNDRYQAVVRRVGRTPVGFLVELSITRRDKAPIHDWRDLQRVKNDIMGPEVEAVELYPAESRLVDTANQYALFCLPKGRRFPFGFRARLVLVGDDGHTRQRAFEDPAVQAEAEANRQRLLAPDGEATRARPRGVSEETPND
jgi:hypothetical protein